MVSKKRCRRKKGLMKLTISVSSPSFSEQKMHLEFLYDDGVILIIIKEI